LLRTAIYASLRVTDTGSAGAGRIIADIDTAGAQ